MARNRLNIQYLSGRVSGDMVYEDVKAGDVVVHRQIVGVADHVDIVLLDDVIWDGILGLAYPNKVLSRKGVVPFFDNVIRSGALKKRGLSNQFGYYIDDSHGSVTFGGVDCSLLGSRVSERNCIQHFGFVPISERTYWTIRINEVSAKYPGKAPIRSRCGRQGCKAIVDTGTYLLYGPGRLVRKMLKPGRFAGCRNYQNLPDFTFDFRVGGDSPAVKLTLRPIDYVLKFTNEGKDECVTGISPDRDSMWTLGQVFLRSFYTVFDRDQNRIGFARLPRTQFQAINAHEDASAQALLESDSHNVLNLNELTTTEQNEVMWAERNTESQLAAEETEDEDEQADVDQAEEQEQEEQDESEQDEQNEDEGDHEAEQDA